MNTLWLKILITLALSIISAFFYRLGGSSKGNTLYRDIGCACVNFLTLFAIGIRSNIFVNILTIGLIFGSMTTYCKFGKQEDVKWYNWLCTGLMYGFTPILYVFFGNLLIHDFIIRMVILGISIMLWSEIIGNDVWEERGRGFLFNISILLYLIH